MSGANGELVKHIFERAPFLRFLGIELTSFGSGWCETSVRATSALEQQHGLIHAGVLMTIADHTCGGAAATIAIEGQDVITVENKVSFLRPTSGSVIVCRAKVLRAGSKLIFAEAEVMTPRDTELIVTAKASSTLAFIPFNKDSS